MRLRCKPDRGDPKAYFNSSRTEARVALAIAQRNARPGVLELELPDRIEHLGMPIGELLGGDEAHRLRSINNQ